MPPRKALAAPHALLPLACALTFAAQALGQESGLSIAIVAVPKDAPSSSMAVVAGQIARQGFERNPKYDVLDLERLLEGGEVSAAEQSRRRGEQALDRGVAAYEAIELQPAAEAFAEAVVAFEQAVAAMEDLSSLKEALRLMGAAYALLGDEKAARRAFEKLLSLDPGASLSDPRIPESVLPVFEAAVERMERQPLGTVTVYAAPPAAEVWVDGRFRGSSPLSVDNLPAGRHYVRVVRDGYASWGTPVDVPPRGEETVQATLRPTSRFAEFDDLARKLASGSEAAAEELAALLKVDQLLWLVVEGAGDDVTITGTLTDGVQGTSLETATKTFVFNSPRFRADLELWLAQTFRKAPGTQVVQGGGGGSSGGSYLPDAPIERPTSGKVIWGWVLIGGAVVPLGVGIGSGIYSLYAWDLYKNEGKIFGSDPVLDHQLDTQLRNVQNAYVISAVLADVGYVLAAASLATGITLLVLGLNEEAQIEDVLAGGEPPLAPAFAIEHAKPTTP